MARSIHGMTSSSISSSPVSAVKPSLGGEAEHVACLADVWDPFLYVTIERLVTGQLQRHSRALDLPPDYLGQFPHPGGCCGGEVEVLVGGIGCSIAVTMPRARSPPYVWRTWSPLPRMCSGFWPLSTF
jgi:hypothetical protein